MIYTAISRCVVQPLSTSDRLIQIDARYENSVQCSNNETDVKLTNSVTDFRQQLNNYTLNHKKRDILFFTITLANLRRFL